ncbi:MAG: hypothetical protein Hyperionvirus1_159 [Hyperionvirus sp.]|uniref:Uncharacterized protein n=1 Tax=Hyperionvirus sp. TaxID=2487770 RepID=A0A3G5A5P8_9VIRU|nr:MAG: hypothetical protein Hyperionvirus1_159 [Hyperionvirus sp.]
MGEAVIEYLPDLDVYDAKEANLKIGFDIVGHVDAIFKYSPDLAQLEVMYLRVTPV